MGRLPGACAAFWTVPTVGANSLPLAWRGVVGGAMMMWARGISEFGAAVILAYHPKIAPTLIYELFEGFGLQAAQPVAALLILVVILVFAVFRRLVMEKT